MPKNILMISDGKIHPPLTGRFWLRYALAGMQGYKFARVNSMEDLLEMDLTAFDSTVLYFHHKKISNAALDTFDTYVSAGGGVLAIHSVTASFKEADRFTEILGGKFNGHGRVEAIAMTPVGTKSQIFNGIPEFQVTDELYLHDLQPDIEVHFTTLYEGQPVPMVWTRTHGKGRVCFACPGHKAASMRVPAYQRVLTSGLAWVCAS